MIDVRRGAHAGCDATGMPAPHRAAAAVGAVRRSGFPRSMALDLLERSITLLTSGSLHVRIISLLRCLIGSKLTALIWAGRP